jgi:hypothetical protein
MKYDEGDLVAINTLDNRTQSAIVLRVFNKRKFFYCYIIEEDAYKLIYDREISFLISKNFAPDFEYDEEIFDLDYAYYEACLDLFSYVPFYNYFIDDEDDSEEE